MSVNTVCAPCSKWLGCTVFRLLAQPASTGETCPSARGRAITCLRFYARPVHVTEASVTCCDPTTINCLQHSYAGKPGCSGRLAGASETGSLIVSRRQWCPSTSVVLVSMVHHSLIILVQGVFIRVSEEGQGTVACKRRARVCRSCFRSNPFVVRGN